MTHLNQHTQIGRIGKVRQVGDNVMVSIGSDASYKKDGEWISRAHWVEHTIFGRQDGLKKWVLEKLQPGDLVSVVSTPQQTSWEKDGEKHYGYTFAVEQFDLLTAKSALAERS